MYYGIGEMLVEWAYDSAQDDVSRTLWATVHTAICVAAVAQTVRVTRFSVYRTLGHLGGIQNLAARAAASKV